MKTLIALGLVASFAAPAHAASSGQAAQTTTATTTQTTTSTAAADIAGSWDVTFNAQQGPIPGKLTFKKDGAKIIGTVTSQVGESPLEAEVKGKAVTVWFSVTMQQGPIAIQLDGTVDGDAMKGSIGAGGQTAGTWEATRAKDAKDAKPADSTTTTTSTASTTATPSLTGTWSVTIELPNMTATPTMALKQEGEKVTGEYVSAQYGKFPMTGTIKGTDVVMSFQMNLEGTSLNVTYSGKLEKDGTMKGSVNYGDMMSGTFIAAKNK
jgi:hypothetical protein